MYSCLAMALCSRNVTNERIKVVLIYVDDLLFMSSDQNSFLHKVKEFLNVFEGTDEGDVTCHLGFPVSASGSMMTLSQPAYIDELLNEYEFQDAKHAATPMQLISAMKLRFTRMDQFSKMLVTAG